MHLTIGFFPPLDNPAPDSRFRRWALQFRRRIRQKVLRLYLASSITSRFIVWQILYLTSFSCRYYGRFAKHSQSIRKKFLRRQVACLMGTAGSSKSKYDIIGEQWVGEFYWLTLCRIKTITAAICQTRVIISMLLAGYI